MKSRIVHAHMKTTATFEHTFSTTTLITGATLEGYTTHSVAGHSVRDSAPRQAPLHLLSPCQCEWTFNDPTGAIQLSGKCASR